jgi:hypothetical protein
MKDLGCDFKSVHIYVAGNDIIFVGYLEEGLDVSVGVSLIIIKYLTLFNCV